MNVRVSLRIAALGIVTLVVLAERDSRSQDIGFFQVVADPNVRYWWDSVPESIREESLSTGDFSNIAPNDYLGPQACRTCHRDKYETWSEHRHRWMNAPANPATVRGDFEDAGIDYFGGRATFHQEDGAYVMRLARGELKRAYRVTQTIGSRFFQYYVGRQIEGPEPVDTPIWTSEHVLPFGYWLDYGEWVPVVHVEKTREGEPSLVDSMRRDPYADPSVHDYARSCSQCHTTMPAGDWLVHRQPSFPLTPRGFSFDLKSYVAEYHSDLLGPTRPEDMNRDAIEQLLQRITHKKAPVWQTTSGISCETCHYGGRAHVESGGTVLPKMFPASPDLFIIGSDASVELARNPTNQNWTCGRCHSGRRFEFAAGMGTWNSTEHTDAMKGACYASGDRGRPHLRCIDCHNPHVTTGKSWTKTPDEDDRLCLKCHSEYEDGSDRFEHTRHSTGSAGSRCMNCHMPRLNEGLQAMVRTHMIFSPTNAAMIEAGQPNACNMCHVGESIGWTLDRLEAWYGRTYSTAARSTAGPATLEWLNSWHPTTQMVAVDVLTKERADWARAEVVNKLDSKYMLVRQFTQIGLQRMLGQRLSDMGYQFYGFEDERRGPLEAIRARFSLDSSDRPTAAESAEAESLAHYRQLVQHEPDSATAHYYLANALVTAGRPVEAVTEYRNALDIDPGFARAHNNLGVALKEVGELQDAIAHHRRALELSPRLAEAQVALGNALLAQGKREASTHFARALEIDPELADAHYNLGLARHSDGRLEDAIEHYRRALEIDPDYADVSNNLGIALQSTGKLTEAVQAFQHAVAVGGADVVGSAHNNLGWAFELSGRLDEALRHFEAALRTNPSSVSAKVGLAWILVDHGNADVRDVERATRLAEEAATTTERRSPEVLNVLSAAYAAAGAFERAIATAETALELAAPNEMLAEEIRARLELYRQRKTP